MNDSGAGSLRQALINSNASGTNDVINFNASIAGQTIVLSTGLPAITKAANSLSIDNTNVSSITVNGNAIIFIYSGTIEMSNLTLINGASRGGTGGAPGVSGGGGGGGGLGAGGAIFLNQGACCSNH